MKELALLNPDDLPLTEIAKAEKRQAVRGIILDKENRVALLHSKTFNYYKIPGGGIESGEANDSALMRECVEEIGCTVEVGEELGSITQVHQVSYCYLGKIIGEKGEPHFTEKELSQGFEIVWLPLDKAIEAISTIVPNEKFANGIQERDLLFLNEARNILKTK